MEPFCDQLQIFYENSKHLERLTDLANKNQCADILAFAYDEWCHKIILKNSGEVLAQTKLGDEAYVYEFFETPNSLTLKEFLLCGRHGVKTEMKFTKRSWVDDVRSCN